MLQYYCAKSARLLVVSPDVWQTQRQTRKKIFSIFHLAFLPLFTFHFSHFACNLIFVLPFSVRCLRSWNCFLFEVARPRRRQTDRRIDRETDRETVAESVP